MRAPRRTRARIAHVTAPPRLAASPSPPAHRARAAAADRESNAGRSADDGDWRGPPRFRDRGVALVERDVLPAEHLEALQNDVDEAACERGVRIQTQVGPEGSGLAIGMEDAAHRAPDRSVKALEGALPGADSRRGTMPTGPSASFDGSGRSGAPAHGTQKRDPAVRAASRTPLELEQQAARGRPSPRRPGARGSQRENCHPLSTTRTAAGRRTFASIVRGAAPPHREDLAGGRRPSAQRHCARSSPADGRRGDTELGQVEARPAPSAPRTMRHRSSPAAARPHTQPRRSGPPGVCTPHHQRDHEALADRARRCPPGQCQRGTEREVRRGHRAA